MRSTSHYPIMCYNSLKVAELSSLELLLLSRLFLDANMFSVMLLFFFYSLDKKHTQSLLTYFVIGSCHWTFMPKWEKEKQLKQAAICKTQVAKYDIIETI